MLIPIDEPDFAGLVRRQSQFAARVAWTVLRDAHDVEDAVQEAFLKLYRNGAWKRIDDEKAFLARAVWRTAIDRLRLRRRESVDARNGIERANPENAAIASDWNAVVHRMIDALPEELRQPLAMAGLEDLNSRQIALAMGISEGTVRTRIMRARQLLKQKLAEYGGGPNGRP